MKWFPCMTSRKAASIHHNVLPTAAPTGARAARAAAPSSCFANAKSETVAINAMQEMRTARARGVNMVLWQLNENENQPYRHNEAAAAAAPRMLARGLPSMHRPRRIVAKTAYSISFSRREASVHTQGHTRRANLVK